MWQRRTLILALVAAAATAQDAPGTLLETIATRGFGPGDAKRLAPLTGPANRAGDLYFPAGVWRVGHRFAVLLTSALILIPGGISACVQYYDTAGARQSETCYQTGWRAFYKLEPSVADSEEFGCEMLTLHVTPVINGRNIRQQWYCLLPDRVVFLGMANDKGRLVPNEFIYPNYTVGPVPAPKSMEEWIALLDSPHQFEIMSALAFLGGRHVPEARRSFDKKGPHAKLVLDLLADERVRECLERLRYAGASPRIREAAALAARDPANRTIGGHDEP